MKKYCGYTLLEGARCVRVDDEGGFRPLDPRFDLARHSPDGFNWGYGGSGPAQLSLAILADVLQDDEKALEYYQAFKFRVIAPIQEKVFEINEMEVIAYVGAIVREDAELKAGKKLD